MFEPTLPDDAAVGPPEHLHPLFLLTGFGGSMRGMAVGERLAGAALQRAVAVSVDERRVDGGRSGRRRPVVVTAAGADEGERREQRGSVRGAAAAAPPRAARGRAPRRGAVVRGAAVRGAVVRGAPVRAPRLAAVPRRRGPRVWRARLIPRATPR